MNNFTFGLMERVNKCPACDGENRQMLGYIPDYTTASAKEEFPYVECMKCGSVYNAERPDVQAIAAYYRESYQPFSLSYHPLVERYLRWRTKREIRAFRRILPTARDVLDVGASTGMYLKALRDIGGFETVGVEMNEEVCRKGREAFRLDIRPGDLLAQNFVPASFDIVVMNHVIEHLYHPHETVARVVELLRPGGIFLVKTPNTDTVERRLFGRHWSPYEAPRHTVVFSSVALCAFLRSHRFVIRTLLYEKTPNNIILSLQNYLKARGVSARVWRRCDISNPVLLLLALPLSFILGVMKQSGRIVVAAQKP